MDDIEAPCDGCGSTESLQSLQARGYVACCPDRRGAPTYIEGFGPSTGDIIRARADVRAEALGYERRVTFVRGDGGGS